MGKKDFLHFLDVKNGTALPNSTDSLCPDIRNAKRPVEFRSVCYKEELSSLSGQPCS
jgi:hypothetical protein